MKNLYLFIALCLFSVGYAQNQTIFKDPSFQAPKLAHINLKCSVGLQRLLNGVNSIYKQQDGKLLISGAFEMYNGNYSQQVIRVNSDGSFDSTFNFVGIKNVESVFQLVPLSNGKSLVFFLDLQAKQRMIRLNNNGSIDTSFNEVVFNIPGVYTIRKTNIKIQSDGKILFSFDTSAPSTSTVNGLNFPNLVRLNQDGSIDSGFLNSISQIFNTSSSSFSSYTDMDILDDGKIIVGGSLYFIDNTVKRICVLNPDGTNYTSFNGESNLDTQFYISNIEITNNNKIICAGLFTGGSVNKIQLFRLNLDGTVDSNFSSGSGIILDPLFYADIHDMVLQPSDDKVIISGSFISYQGVNVKNVFRINLDGSLDTTFDFQQITSTDLSMVTKIRLCLDSNEDLYVTGDYNNFETNTRKNGLIKVNSNGLLSPSFSSGTGFTLIGTVNKVLELQNQKIVIAGEFDYVNGVERHGIAFLNNNGTLDESFGVGYGFDEKAIINSVLEQPDGKIIIGGSFSSYKGVNVKGIIRLNSDGTIDQNFNAGGTGFSDVNTMDYGIYDMQLQSDGKIIAAGNFYSYNSVSSPGLVRINPDGSRDTSFVVGTGFDKRATIIRIQPNGEILATGFFTKYNNVTNNGFIRLNNNGSKDTSFSTSPFALVGVPNTFSIFPDGTILSSRAGGSLGLKLAKSSIDGVLDPNFNSFFRQNISICSLLVQPDNKLIVSGNNSYNVKCLYRLNDDGSLDYGFNTGNDFDLQTSYMHRHGTYYFNNVQYKMSEVKTSVKTTSIQSNGMLLVGGLFSHFNGEESVGLVRLINIPSYNFKGTNYFDQNSDGCDSSHPKFSNLNFNVVSNNGDFSLTANNTGDFNVGLAAGNYAVTPTVLNSNYFNISPSSITVNFPTQSSPNIQNFCITPNGVHQDLEVTILPINAARPGFDAKYKLVYKNKGNQVQSGTINLTFNDAVLDFVSATPVVSSQAFNLLSWNFSNLNPFETREVLFTLNLNSPTETPALNTGSVLNYTAAVTSAQTDETPNDNTFVFNQTVVNSFDPNDKICLEGITVGTDKVGEYVHYIIHFENTGSYAAQNIVVKDLVDTNKFDVASIVPLNGSHLFTTKISEGNKVEFMLENINLPFAAGTDTGYVAFKIKTKATLVSGDTFGGNASIYFDYNSAITTNTYTTTIQALNVKDFSFGNYFNLYPNPVSDILNISKKDDIEISSIHIYNVMGQLMMVIPNAKNTATIDVSNLASGNYFVKVNSDRGTSNTKFIKR